DRWAATQVRSPGVPVRHRRTVRAGRRLSLVVAAAVAVIVSVPVVVSRLGPAPAATFTCGGPADLGWPGGPFEVAFQANTGSLWTTAAEGSANWESGMMPGTSPAVAALSGGGFEVAFQANTGHLWTVGSAGCRDWPLGMMWGSSPAIAGLAGGGFEVAFEANTSNLWTVGSAGNTAWPFGMAPGTNPTLAAPVGAPFASSISGIDAPLAERMRTSWRPGCPVPLSDLRYLTVTYRGFEGGDHVGELVVAASVAPAVVEVFRRLHAIGYPLASVRLVDDFGGSDDQSMAADNSSAFNCRPVTGGTGFSQHSFGTAIDLNPVQNPYLSGTLVLPEQGRAFLARTAGPGVILPGDAVVSAFAGIGWSWGGVWTNPVDYMHFSASGR
ncbi:MAG TPA: M15 family metallopeptidase, partial [Nakamurella sp.]